jgi:hypothetical protein
MGKTKLVIPVGQITFYIVLTLTLFLFYIDDIDSFGIYFDNTRNKFVASNGKRIPIMRKYGYLWFFLDEAIYVISGIIYMSDLESIGNVFLIEVELRRVYRRFGYPLVDRFWKVLQ